MYACYNLAVTCPLHLDQLYLSMHLNLRQYIFNYLVVNVAFAYLFMGEEVEWIKRALCRLYQEKCPVAK